MRQATFDIELALMSPSSVWEDLQRRLGDTCTFEDRLEQGSGLVIRPPHSNDSLNRRGSFFPYSPVMRPIGQHGIR